MALKKQVDFTTLNIYYVSNALLSALHQLIPITHTPGTWAGWWGPCNGNTEMTGPRPTAAEVQGAAHFTQKTCPRGQTSDCCPIVGGERAVGCCAFSVTATFLKSLFSPLIG